MLDFEFGLGDDIEILRQTLRSFAQSELAPRADEIDRSNVFPRDLWPRLGELGLRVEDGQIVFRPILTSQRGQSLTGHNLISTLEKFEQARHLHRILFIKETFAPGSKNLPVFWSSAFFFLDSCAFFTNSCRCSFVKFFTESPFAICILLSI
jgi:hypothetical protein